MYLHLTLEASQQNILIPDSYNFFPDSGKDIAIIGVSKEN
jgi:hypothetical protein